MSNKGLTHDIDSQDYTHLRKIMKTLSKLDIINADERWLIASLIWSRWQT
jgi:hypothetical protein